MPRVAYAEPYVSSAFVAVYGAAILGPMRRAAKKIDELVVRPRYSARRRLFIAALGLLVFLLSAFLLYDYGLTMAGFDRSTVNARQKALMVEITELQEQNQSLRESLARAELLVETNQTAYQELDQTLKASAQETLKLREELEFYRNIISPTGKTGGLQIQRLHITQGGGAGQYRYRLVLIQALKHERNVGGRIEFDVMGEKEGAASKVRFPNGESAIGFNFKYFQNIEGKWDLPAGFNPKEVVVRVLTAGADSGVEQTFPWPRAS